MFTHQIKENRPAAELMKDNMLVKHYAGSLSYGTNLPTSDVDFRGIFCGDPINILTPFYVVRECDDATEEDTKLYELAHFFKLCLDCNPNIVETLYVSTEHITFKTEAYDFIREHRSDFLSQKIAYTTSGYAMSQLKRMKTAKKQVNYLPDLIRLCELLSKAVVDGEIDGEFIHINCGNKVLTFMRENKYI